jgi:serine/threonine protein kinase
MHPYPCLPDYELLRELGGGPVTRVLEARHRDGQFPCAVKLLRPEWADDLMAQQMLRREARTGLAVRHRQLVKLLDAQVTRDPVYIVMELLGGETLRARLSRDYALEPRDASGIARQTAEALAAVHKAGFVHGDVKPDNVRLVDAGSAVLMDLGFAHRPGELEALIRDGYLFGTPEYLAPELCGFEADHAFASDWFSFGLMLFEMLTGELPYPAGEPAELLTRHQSMDLAWAIKARSAHWPPRMKLLMQRLLSRQPAERPGGATVVQELVALEIASLGATARRAA